MHRQRIPPHLAVILSAAFVSDFGLGLTLPFLLIYLHEVRRIGLGLAGVLIGVVGVSSLLAAPVIGAAADRLGLRFVAISALVTQAAGTASLAFVTGPVSAAGAMILLGIGQGAVYTVWFALLGALSGNEQLRPKVFARNAQLLNLGLAAGSVVGGVLVHVSDPSSFVTVYLLGSGSDLIFVAVLALMPAATFARTASGEVTGPVAGELRGYRAVLSDRKMVRFLAVALALAIGGYGSLNAGFVGFATTAVRVSPQTVSFAFAANMVFIVLAQPAVLRWSARIRRTSALSIVAVVFAISWILLGAAAGRPGSALGEALTIAMMVVFSLGETLQNPVAIPLVNDIAPAQLGGRYNASASVITALGNVVGPVIAGGMLGAGLGPEYIGLLVLCCLAGLAAAQGLKRVLAPADDRVATGGPGPQRVG